MLISMGKSFHDWQGREVQLVTISSYKVCMSKYIFQDLQDFILLPIISSCWFNQVVTLFLYQSLQENAISPSEIEKKVCFFF